jgi:hypothetical protein
MTEYLFLGAIVDGTRVMSEYFGSQLKGSCRNNSNFVTRDVVTRPVFCWIRTSMLVTISERGPTIIVKAITLS